MTKGDPNTPMAHQSKKKRTDEEPPTQDPGQKPIQLQRRRVWRACESCRHVDLTAVVFNEKLILFSFTDARRSNVMAANLPAPSAVHQARSALGCRPKIGPR